MRKYITPQTTATRSALAELLCQSGLSDDSGIPDLVEDEFDW